jgi:hypothetical protein
LTRGGGPADLREGSAEELSFPDAGFDTVVCALAVCAIGDRAAAGDHSGCRPCGLGVALTEY